MQITPTTLTIAQLLGSRNEQYCVPAYQRRYSWREKQLKDLITDIEQLEEKNKHLLGTIVCLVGPHTGNINELELVDGQQRLTTLSILLRCIAQALKNKDQENTIRRIEDYLNPEIKKERFPKIRLDSIDQMDFVRLLEEQPTDPPDNEHLAAAFTFFQEWVVAQETGMLVGFLEKLENNCIVIRLEINAAKDAFKLFEIINNRGLRLSPTDIIKNFVLGNAARFNAKQLETARKNWSDLVKHLDGSNFDHFFRQFLCSKLKRRIRSSQMVVDFKTFFMLGVREAKNLPEYTRYTEGSPATKDTIEDEEEFVEGEDNDWDGEDENSEEPAKTENSVTKRPGIKACAFTSFLKDLVKCAKTYGEIVHAKTGNAKFDSHLFNLRMIDSRPSYGFLMALRVGNCEEKDFISILGMTEAFVLRRHICKARSSEIETVFARLCGIDPSDPIPEVTNVFKEYSPSNDKFRSDFSSFAFTANLIDRARYCLEQFELKKHRNTGELKVSGAGEVHVEHIIPKKIKTQKAKRELGDWPACLGSGSEDDHVKYVHRIGNLTLFAGNLNIQASNNPYESKKEQYKKSAIRLTKILPDKYANFRFKQVQERSDELAKLAVKIWPIPKRQRSTKRRGLR